MTCIVVLVFLYMYLGAVKPEELIRYAHMISQASSVVSPLGWQPSQFTEINISRVHVENCLSLCYTCVCFH